MVCGLPVTEGVLALGLGHGCSSHLSWESASGEGVPPTLALSFSKGQSVPGWVGEETGQEKGERKGEQEGGGGREEGGKVILAA